MKGFDPLQMLTDVRVIIVIIADTNIENILKIYI